MAQDPGHRILLVDDNEKIRSLIDDALQMEPESFQVFHASNGEEAITAVEENSGNFDAIVLDLQMPVTNGWETLRILHDDDGYPDIPVIMLTVQSELENAAKAWSLGARFFVSKPVSIPVLIDAVKRAVGEKSNAV